MPNFFDNTAHETFASGDNIMSVYSDPTSHYVFVGINDTYGLRAFTFDRYNFTCVNTATTNGQVLGITSNGGDYIFTANYNLGIRAYLFDGYDLTCVGSYQTAGARDVAYVNSFVVVADGSYGLKSFSFNGSGFTLVDSINPSINAYKWSVSSQGVAFLSTFANGIYAYEVDQNGDFNQLASDTNPLFTFDLHYDNEREQLFVPKNNGHVYAYTFDGNSFTGVGSVDSGGTAFSIFSDEGYVYIGHYTEGIRAYTFEAPTFSLVSSRDDGGQAYRLFKPRTSYLFAANYDDGLRAYYGWTPPGLSDWFIGQLHSHASEPERYLTLAGSDHSSRVTAWPTIRRDISKIKPVNLSLKLSNTDGTYNDFWLSTHTITTSASIDIGYTHPIDGAEPYRLYTGHVHKVTYSDLECVVYLRDKFYDLAQRKVGSTDDPVTFGSTIPTEIAWTLCTCYGGLSSVRSDTNVDIDYGAFLEWSYTFSADQVTTQAHFEGDLIVGALGEIFNYTESFGYINGSGQLVFNRLDEIAPNDYTIEDLHWKKAELEVDAEALINKQYVSYNYSVSSDYWLSQTYRKNSASVNSFGLHEGVAESENIWYTNALDAKTLASRKIGRYSDPVKRFTLNLPLYGIKRDLGETVRLVNSFYGIDTDVGWRIAEQQINLSNFSTQIKTDSALGLMPFYLDIDFLDGDKRLL